jgi:hypothetical protein
MASTLRTYAPSAPAVSVMPTRRVGDGGPRCAADVHWLKLPRADQGLRYALLRWAVVLPALWQGHRLQPQRATCYASRFEPRKALGDRFAKLFDLRRGPGGVDDPVLHAQGVIGLLQARVLADLGVQGRHVRLLRHRTRLPGGVAPGLATRTQDIDCRLARVVRVGPTEVVALIETHIADPGGRTLLQAEDAFIVRDLEVADVVQADEDDLLRRALGRMRRRGPGIDPAARGVRWRQLYVAPDAGRRFARLAGGQGRWPWRCAPVPPMYLRHLVSRELSEWGLEGSGLQITFIGKAGPGQMLRLLLQGDAFELIDERGRLLAFGNA